MNPAHTLIHHLEGVRERGAGKWVALCPAHEDRSPSLSIEECGDRLLVHCFAGCGAAEVMEAVGLNLSDLFENPPEPVHRDNIHPLGRSVVRRWIDGAWTPTGPDKPTRGQANTPELSRSNLRLALFESDRDCLRVAIAAENITQGEILGEGDMALVLDSARNLGRLASRFRAWEF